MRKIFSKETFKLYKKILKEKKSKGKFYKNSSKKNSKNPEKM